MAGLLAFAVGIVCILCPWTCTAHQTYQSRIPNGNNVKRNGQSWAGVGHNTAAGGTPRNQFGLDFAAQGHQWTNSLCQDDSDGDGQSNGYELGDPDCVWTQGDTPARTTDISHPGFSDSMAQTTVTTSSTTMTTDTASTSSETSPTSVTSVVSAPSTLLSSSSPSSPTSPLSALSTLSSGSSTSSEPSTVSSLSTAATEAASSTSSSPSSTSSSPSSPSTGTSSSTSASTATAVMMESIVVEGSLELQFSTGSADAFLEAYNNDTTGAIDQALKEAVAAPLDDVTADLVTITGVEISNTSRRLTDSGSSGASIITSFEIDVTEVSVDGEAIVGMLSASESTTAIITALNTGLAAANVDVEVSSIAVTAEVQATTTTPLPAADSSFEGSHWMGCFTAFLLSCLAAPYFS